MSSWNLQRTKQEKKKENPNEPLILDLIQNIKTCEQREQLIPLLQKLGDLARDENNRESIGQMEDVLDTLVSILNRYGSQVDVESKVLRVFANLAYYHTKNAENICNVEKRSYDVISLCIKHIQLYKTEGELARLACATMTNLCHDDDNIRNQVVYHNGVHVLAEILREYLTDLNKEDPYDMKAHLLRVFDNLSESGEALEAFLKENVLDILLDYLQNSNLVHSDSYLYLSRLTVKLLEIISVSKIFQTEAIKRNVVGILTSLLIHAISLVPENEDELEEVNDLILQIVTSLQGMVKSEANFSAQMFEGDQVDTIQLLIRLLNRTESTEKIKESVVELLALVAEKDALQQPLLQEGILEPIIIISDRVTKQKETAKIHHSRLLRFAIKILSFLALDNNNLAPLIEKGAGNVLVDTLNGLYEIQEQFGPEDMSTFQQMNTFVLRNTCIGLGNLARTDENCVSLVKLGAVKALVNFLSKGTDVNKVDLNLLCNAAFALTNLTKADSVKEAIVSEGVVDVLKSFIKDEVPFALQFYATDSLANLVKNKIQHVQLITAGADTSSSILDQALHSMKTLKDQPKMRYIVTKLLLTISEDPAAKKLVINRLQADPELTTLIKELDTNEDKKIHDIALEAKSKLGI
jgi:hypothetical protein